MLFEKNGEGGQARTDDLRIKSPGLYQLSYASTQLLPIRYCSLLDAVDVSFNPHTPRGV